MGNGTLRTAKDGQNNSKPAQTVEVLYQRMGDRWFAFSLIGDEVFVGSISPEELQWDAKQHDLFEVSGNS